MSQEPSRSSQLPFQTDFTADEFIARRRSVMAGMNGQGIALLAGIPAAAGYDPIRQNNDFYYLCGVEVPHAYLILDAEQGRSTLYLSPPDPKHEATDGPDLSSEDGEFCLARCGVDAVKPIGQLVDDLRSKALVYLMRTPGEGPRQCQDTLRHMLKCIAEDPMNARPSAETHLLLRLSQFSPRAEIRDLSPIVHRLRLIKSPAEVAVMRKAAHLTTLATTEIMRSIRPGLYEHQLAAVADYLWTLNGAQGSGYRPIIATGANLWMMHYWRNNSRLVDGELILFDCAPDYHYYTCDIGRMMPVGGVYSRVQRELYGFVLAHHAALLDACRPGKTVDEIYAETAERMAPVVEAWRWSKAIYRTGAQNLLKSRRPLSHGVGMAVHEAADWRGEKIRPGLVFTVDPELVIPEEKLYLRVEDTVVASEDGIENLTVATPREMDDVERVMKDRGMIQAYPPLGNFR